MRRATRPKNFYTGLSKIIMVNVSRRAGLSMSLSVMKGLINLEFLGHFRRRGLEGHYANPRVKDPCPQISWPRLSNPQTHQKTAVLSHLAEIVNPQSYLFFTKHDDSVSMQLTRYQARGGRDHVVPSFWNAFLFEVNRLVSSSPSSQVHRHLIRFITLQCECS